MPLAPSKIGKCVSCKEPTPNRVGLKFACNIEHAIEYTNRIKAKKIERVKKDERKELAIRKKNIKTLSAWLRETQIIFNTFIRLRDAGEPCISCGRLHGGKINAGHFRTVAAAGHLRFDERNVHAQCEPCNSNLSGNIINYRPRLIQKIGEDRTIELENDNSIRKWTVEDCIRIKAEYREKIKQLKINNE